MTISSIQQPSKTVNSVLALREQGAHTVLCRNNKAPIDKQWQLSGAPENRIRTHTGVFGLMPASLGLVVIDVDSKHHDLGELRAAIVDSLGEPVCEVKTKGNGGLHLYYRSEKAQGTIFYKWQQKEAGEIRSANGYVILWDADAILAALENLSDYDEVDTSLWPFVPEKETTQVVDLRGSRPGPKQSPTSMRRQLDYIDPDSDYDTWLGVGQALHKEGYDLSLWEEWSSKGRKYKEGECAKKWGSFRLDKDRLRGLRWLENLFMDNGPQWKLTTSKGRPAARAVSNAVAALERMTDLSFSYNDFSGEEEILGKPLADVSVLWIQRQMEERFQFSPTKDALYGGVSLLSREDTYHPVRDYLTTCQKNWDGRRRLARLGENYFATDNSALQNAIARLIIMGMVARVMYPGCKFDYMPIMRSGKQGMGKSESLEVLGGDWFGDGFSLDANDPAKVLMERTRNVWVMESAEIGGFAKADTEKVKACVTQRTDRARLAYGRLATVRPRQFVLVGTTNEPEFLTDTENRRFPVLHILADIDVDGLRRDRNQIFGEALDELKHYPDGHVTLNPALWQESEEFSQQFRQVTAQEEWIRDWLDGRGNPTFFVASELRKEFATSGIRGSNKGQSKVLDSMGYKRDRKRIENQQKQVWRKA